MTEFLQMLVISMAGLVACGIILYIGYVLLVHVGEWLCEHLPDPWPGVILLVIMFVYVSLIITGVLMLYTYESLEGFLQ